MDTIWSALVLACLRLPASISLAGLVRIRLAGIVRIRPESPTSRKIVGIGNIIGEAEHILPVLARLERLQWSVNRRVFSHTVR